MCTTRAGGVSVPPYDSLNLGDHVGDNPIHVAANRGLLQEALGVPSVFLSQVHGTHVERLSSSTPHGTQADGCFTAQPRLACTIMVADCLPVLLTNLEGRWVGAAHAGWRGLVGPVGHGILDSIFKDIRALSLVDKGKTATNVIAWLGPCIGPDAFEVGDDVRDAFVAGDLATRSLFKPTSTHKWLADLPGLARLRLAALGVTQIYGNDGSRAWCTFSNPSRFFSHRRDRVSGRIAVCIWRD